ncbi:2TM domain-containing protein [Flavobacterium sp.]|uniref:2TM domain-containing protein n=1 Tax=Flavobacterium sp. TaxID=239 RepID=UPI00286AB45F|nr:2TM domain-containing protein [Flavobacterium sp.]
METNNDFENYNRAKKKVEKIKGFYSHLTSYIVVMAVLIFINLKYSPEYLWFFWTLLGWGTGLFFHAMNVFNFAPFLNTDWENRKIKQFMDEENKNNKFE